jgi:hypothetical protein
MQSVIVKDAEERNERYKDTDRVRNTETNNGSRDTDK